MIPSYVIFYTRVIPIHGSVSSSLLLLCKHELFYCQIISVNAYYYYYYYIYIKTFHLLLVQLNGSGKAFSQKC